MGPVIAGIAIQIGRTLVQSLVSMGAALLTETFLKHAVLVGLEKLAKRTATDTDDRLVEAAREAWNVPDGPK